MKMITKPENKTNLIGDVMSNFDGEIDTEIAEKLKEENSYADYPAWNFHANVWLKDGIYYALVRRYHNHESTEQAETLEELMVICREEYGSC